MSLRAWRSGRPPRPGRLILIAGGIAGVLVAANPEPARGGSLAHAFWAAIGFVALTVWPLGGLRRGSSVPGGLRPAVAAVAAGALLGLFVWFAAELMTRGGQVGLAERILTGAQAVWPLAVVWTCWRSVSPAQVPVGPGAVTSCPTSRGPAMLGIVAGRRDVRPRERVRALWPELALGGIHWACYSGSLNAFLIRSRPYAGLEIRSAASSLSRDAK
jgi:uncharacterized protein DUF998